MVGTHYNKSYQSRMKETTYLHKCVHVSLRALCPGNEAADLKYHWEFYECYAMVILNANTVLTLHMPTPFPRTIDLSSMKKYKYRHFPEGPVVKTLSSDAGGAVSIPGWGAKISCTLRPKNQNIKQKQYCNKFNKDLKNSPHF